MTSLRDQIIAESDAAIASGAVKLKELEAEHEQFVIEDALSAQHRKKAEALSEQASTIRNARFKGIYPDGNSWQRGISTPLSRELESKFDARDVNEALTEIVRERGAEIENGEEYQTALQASQDESQKAYESISDRHRELHQEIETLSNRIIWHERRKRYALTDRSWLSLYGKDLKAQQARDAKLKEHRDRIETIKSFVKKKLEVYPGHSLKDT